MAEMMGRATGSSKGKGGSMHYYNSKNNFYGGNGIVGAQMPVGTGLAFAQKYLKEKNFTVTLYGDGAANQGQLFEAANIAGLWKLPIVYVCENNGYAMGTSQDRHALNTDFYTRGDKIPGIKVDAMNVLAVKETTEWMGRYVKEHGPLFCEMLTYRYHGHSMSDPGVTYRTKDEIADVRKTRDPVEQVRAMVLSQEWATEAELKDMEKAIRKTIESEVKQIQKDPFPAPEELYTDMSATPGHYIRGVTYETSILNPE